MSEMVERVSLALFKETGTPFTHWAMNSSGRSDFAVLARAAIAAMQEPTETMNKAGGNSQPEHIGMCPDCAPVVYRAMIDAALS